MTTVRTLKQGTDADARVLLTLADTTVPNTDPTAAEIGYHLQGCDRLHIYVEFGDLTQLDLTPWFYFTGAQKWFAGAPFSITPNANGTGQILVKTNGEERIFLVVDSVNGTGTFKLWAGYSFGEPGRE